MDMDIDVYKRQELYQVTEEEAQRLKEIQQLDWMDSRGF